MTSRITLLMAVAAAALAIVPTALGEGRLAGSLEPDGVAYFYANERATLASPDPVADFRANERAPLAEQGLGTGAVVQRGDDFLRERPEIAPTPAQAVNQSSDSHIEWAQLGMGFGLGILLAVGLWLAIRMTKHREFAH
jgi:hypothetical protein